MLTVKGQKLYTPLDLFHLYGIYTIIYVGVCVYACV